MLTDYQLGISFDHLQSKTGAGGIFDISSRQQTFSARVNLSLFILSKPMHCRVANAYHPPQIYNLRLTRD